MVPARRIVRRHGVEAVSAIVVSAAGTGLWVRDIAGICGFVYVFLGIHFVTVAVVIVVVVVGVVSFYPSLFLS